MSLQFHMCRDNGYSSLTISKHETLQLHKQLHIMFHAYLLHHGRSTNRVAAVFTVLVIHPCFRLPNYYVLHVCCWFPLQRICSEHQRQTWFGEGSYQRCLLATHILRDSQVERSTPTIRKLGQENLFLCSLFQAEHCVYAVNPSVM